MALRHPARPPRPPAPQATLLLAALLGAVAAAGGAAASGSEPDSVERSAVSGLHALGVAEHKGLHVPEREQTKNILRPTLQAWEEGVPESEMEEQAGSRKLLQVLTRKEALHIRIPPPAPCSERAFILPAEQQILWKPTEEKYVLAVCRYGESSNGIVCLERYMLLTALLNRTLVISRHTYNRIARYDWDWDLLMDVKHARKCFGDNTVISLAEYKRRYPRADDRVVVDELVCWKTDCPALPKKIGDHRPDIIWPPEAAHAGFKAFTSLDDIMPVFNASRGRLITFGDLYGTQVHYPPDWLFRRPYGPMKRSCLLPILPHPAIAAAAEGFVQTFTGGNFIALHLRRGDKYKYWRQCNWKDWCYWPVTEIASCLLEIADRIGATTVFAANNGHPLEVRLLRRLLARRRRHGLKPVTLLTMPESLEEAGGVGLPWARQWSNLGFDENKFAMIPLEKLICSFSTVFVTSGESTFSEHISRMRQALGTFSCMDGMLCEGRLIKRVVLMEKAPLYKYKLKGSQAWFIGGHARENCKVGKNETKKADWDDCAP